MNSSGPDDEQRSPLDYNLPDAGEEIRPGEMLLLPKPMVGLRPGLYAVLSITEKTITICPAGRDDEGKVCPQDGSVTVDCADLARFLRVEDTAMETYH
jgi:hypothetical protein